MHNHLAMLAILAPVAWMQAQIWSPIAFPSVERLPACSFISPDTGWVIKSNGNASADSIYRTNDGGISWTSQPYPADPPFNIRQFTSVHFINADVGVISCGNYLYTGVDPTQVSNILWTNDGGATWTYKNMGDSHYWLDAKLVNATTAYGIGQYGERKKTTDGGATWIDQYSVSPFSGSKLFPITEDTVYYAGLENLSMYAVFGRTDNGGLLWSASPVPADTSTISIHFNDRLHGWLGGYNGEILYTDDGGFSWTPCTSGVTSPVRDLEFIDALNGWAVTWDGQILRSVDGGLNWSVEYAGTIPLHDIDMTGSTGYAVGQDGTVLKYGGNVGMDPAASIARMAIAPNPCTTSTTIMFDRAMRDAEVTVHDHQGRLVLRMTGVSGPSLRLETEQLHPGLYFVSVLQNGGLSTARFAVAAAG